MHTQEINAQSVLLTSTFLARSVVAPVSFPAPPSPQS